jgi:hypothetical protein
MKAEEKVFKPEVYYAIGLRVLKHFLLIED